MRRSKSLSSFSIAAVALLAAAAVPCFAQNQSSGPAEVKSGLVADGNVLDLLFNRKSNSEAPRTGFVFIEPKNLADTAHVTTSSALSRAIFKVTNQLNAKENEFSFDLQLHPYNPNKQFLTDDESDAEQSKSRITFVPSRGPKFPS